MFTGIVETTGTIESIAPVGQAMRLSIRAPELSFDDVAAGDSIAVSGPCLTVTTFDSSSFAVDVSTETLARTTLGQRKVGDKVNLEKALRLSDRLGGHIVSGHVDGIGRVSERSPSGDYVKFGIAAPVELARYIAFKGSITVDGVSLTVNAVSDSEFELLIIPHTLEVTTLGSLAAGDDVNLEIDIVARYLERMLDVDAKDGDESLWTSLVKSGIVRE